MKMSDSRSKKITEIVTGIKIIKFNAWEGNFINQIDGIRKKEKSNLINMFFIDGIISGIGNFTPLLCGLISIWLFNTYYERLTTAQTYSLIALYSNLAHPIKIFMMAWVARLNGIVSGDRVMKILKKKDKEEFKDDKNLELGCLKIEDGSFGWELKTENEEKKRVILVWMG